METHRYGGSLINGDRCYQWRVHAPIGGGGDVMDFEFFFSKKLLSLP